MRRVLESSSDESFLCMPWNLMVCLAAPPTGVVEIELHFLCKAVIIFELSRACICFEFRIPLKSVVGWSLDDARAGVFLRLSAA